MHIYKTWFFLILSLFFVSCSTADNISTSKQSAKLLYENAIQEANNKNYENSNNTFQSILEEFPYSIWATKSKVMMAWVYYEENLIPKSKSVINRIENIAPFHKGFQMLSQSLKPSVHQLLGEEPTLFKEKINFKLSGGSGFKAHQDSQAGWNKYADFFISALVSIDESTLENGCLEISKLPTSKLVFDPWEPLSKEQTKHMEFVPITTKPGDLIFFDCFAPHQSSKNNTKKPRRLYYATYNRLSAGDHLKQYYADKHESYPPDIDRAKDKNYTFRV